MPTIADQQPLRPVSAIYVDTPAGLRLVEAIVIGHFGIHASDQAGWALTHVGSGSAIAKDLPSQAAAAELAKVLLAMRVDWDFRDRKTVSTWTKYRRDALLKAIDAAGGQRYQAPLRATARPAQDVHARG